MAEQRNINEMKDSELGLLLGQQYQMIMQAQGNIQAITTELDKRNKEWQMKLHSDTEAA